VRVGWIHQLSIEREDWEPVEHFHSADTVDRWFDRFHCHWQELTGGFLRVRYGPACVELAEAIAWCERHSERAFIDVFGERWSTGAPREGFGTMPSMAERLAREAERWGEHANNEWAVEVRLSLGPRDYDDAAPIFAESLRALVAVDRCTLDWVGARLSAHVRVWAPTLELAREIACHTARQAASDLPGGLRDETGEVFDARVNRVGDRWGPG
jgi:hypothetical protein